MSHHLSPHRIDLAAFLAGLRRRWLRWLVFPGESEALDRVFKQRSGLHHRLVVQQVHLSTQAPLHAGHFAAYARKFLTHLGTEVQNLPFEPIHSSWPFFEPSHPYL